MDNQSSIRWEQDADQIVTLILDDPAQSVNTMNECFQHSLRQTVGRLQQEQHTIKGLIITSAKKTFFAGADLRLMIQAKPEQAARISGELESLKHQLRCIETLGIPVVAAINGTALGGGFEIALACHYRIAMDIPGVELGLPEVRLGLMPGGGGVVRTVRMLGIQSALMNVLLQGPRMRPATAKEQGLVHELVADRETMLEVAHQWIKANPRSKQPWDVPGYKIPGGTPSTPALAMNLPAFPSNLRKQLKGAHAHYPAPAAIMAAAIEGAQVDVDNALKIETRYFVQLVTGTVSKNMIQAFFFDLQQINSGRSRPSRQEFPVATVHKLGIVGAGMMGQGIAYVSAMAGIEVVLLDTEQSLAERGRAYSEGLLKKRLSRGKIAAEQAQRVLSKIVPTTEYALLSDCDLVIEAVFEDRQIKAAVSSRVGAVLEASGILASNTSTIPIGSLAAAFVDPQRFIGLHFFSPVDKMPLVEIICGAKTQASTLALAFDFVLQIRKTPIVVNDRRGFFTSRVFATYCYEGVAMLDEGYPAASIEQAAAQAGMPVGPLAVMDEVNLELTRTVRRQTQSDMRAEGLSGSVHPAERVIDRMCDEFHRPGKREGAGFYEYPQSGKKHLWAGLKTYFADSDRAEPSVLQFQEMHDRLLYRQSIEAIRCYEEGVVCSVADANIGSIFGIGMAPWTGGVLQFVEYVGMAAFVQRAQELTERYGARFAPPKLLLDMLASGAHFVEG